MSKQNWLPGSPNIPQSLPVAGYGWNALPSTASSNSLEAGDCEVQHSGADGDSYHMPFCISVGSKTPKEELCVRPRALEGFFEFLQQPSCKVVLGTALLLGGGGLVLWTQRKKKKTASESTRDKSPESHRANDSWIKSHFSRLSEERLPTSCYVSNNGPPLASRHGEANTSVHMDTLTSTHGEGGTALRRDSFASKQKVSGTSVTKETQRESGKSSLEDETWAAVAACAKEIDAKGHRVANSMLQRSTPTYQRTGHSESRDISPDELKALEEVEIKLKGNFLTQRETTLAGANQTHTIYSQSRQSHQSHHPAYQSSQSHPVYSSHPGHYPSHLSHQGYPSYSSHQSHLGHSNHQGHQVHSRHQSHSLPNRSHQNYAS
ncbi:uncharacterized protein C10orf62 homolog [Acomys russatus]|uniref:uncharacterized protein C10orf62 homolog n=1 Tax=Acomys russatus TaxID=60746 RepID=UPI0021E1EADB|nr:uncharacterized protein C10orf62 homolog [Acomys russatus]